MTKVKQQHYVWRKYLKPWADREMIWTCFKKLNKIEKVNLMGVAQERYFYRLIDLSESEELFLKNYIEENSPPVVKNLNFDFLRLFTSTSRLKKQLEESINPNIDKEKLTKEIEILETNLMENAHTRVEALGHKLLEYRTLSDLKTIKNDDYLFEAILFLCFQYVRTKNMKVSAMEYCKGKSYEKLVKKIWNILSYVTAATLARNISVHPNLRFIFIENATTNLFITGDQPVFNILNDKVNDNGDIIDLEFYYPITPKHALIIHFREDQLIEFISKSADDSIINFLNGKVVENSDFYVFANNEEQLRSIM